jgi:hypothetical protein
MRVSIVVVIIFVAGLGRSVASAQSLLSPLRDQNCSSKPTLVMLLEGVSVYATCDNVGNHREVQFVVQNRGGSDDRKVNGFSIGFCAGPFASIHSPAGWASEIRDENRVRWAVRYDDNSAAIPTGTKLDGFSVILEPGWAMAGSYGASWFSDGQGGAGFGSGSRHHCQ